MQRCLLTAAILVAVNCGPASADYVLVKIDLNELLQPSSASPSPAPGGFPGAPGTIPQGRPQQPAFNPKVGGKGGGRGGFGGGGGFQQGFPGQPGIPGQPGQNAAVTGPKLPPMYVYAYVEVKGKAPVVPAMMAGKAAPFNIWVIDGKVGNQKVNLWLPERAITYQTTRDMLFTSKPRKFAADLQASTKSGTDDAKKQKILLLAESALQLGHLKEFNTAMEELKKLNAKDAIVATVVKTRELLKKKPANDDPAAKALADELRTKENYRPIASDEGHYTLLTNIEASRDFDDDWKKKLSTVEELYATFFYWWALKGQTQTPPDYRFVIVLVDTGTNAAYFEAKHAAFNSLPMIGNGFMVQRDNTLVLASRRMDPVYEALDNYNQDVRNKLGLTTSADQAALMTNPGALVNHPQIKASGKSPYAVLPIAQTVAVCQKSMNDETEMVALSHGAIRQLVTSTGLLPRNVDTAEWARYGVASFFEIPEQSFYPSTGGANWDHLVEFKALRKSKILDYKDKKDILLRVVTDAYFHRANSMLKQLDPSKEDPIGHYKAHEQLELARATAWSLMYYLAHNEEKHLARYFAELRGLPRDLDFDGRVLRDCFYRAFDLLGPDPENANRQTVDVLKLERLAKKWFDMTDSTYLDLLTYETLAVKWREDDLKGIARAPQPTSPTQPTPGLNPAGLKQGTPAGGFPPGKGGVPPGPGGS